MVDLKRTLIDMQLYGTGDQMMSKFAAVTSLAACLSVLGCGGPTEKERKVINELTREMKEECLGRMFVSLPKDFKWSPYARVTLYYGRDADFKTMDVSIADTGVDQELFDRRVSERVAEIASETNIGSGESVLKSHAREASGVHFIERYQSFETDRAVTYEAHLLIEGVQVFVEGDAYSRDRDAVANNVRKLAGEISVASGADGERGDRFCLGPLLIKSNQDYEVVIFHASGGRSQDGVLFEFYTSSMERSGSGETLGARVDEASDYLGSRMKVLRRGSVSVDGEEAEQALVRFKQLEGRHSLSFGLWSMRTAPGLSRPSFTLSMSTQTEVGGESASAAARNPIAFRELRDLPSGPVPIKFDSALTDEEAMGLWDAVVKSIRSR